MTRPGGLLVFGSRTLNRLSGLPFSTLTSPTKPPCRYPSWSSSFQGLPVQFAAVREMQFPGVQDRFRWLTPSFMDERMVKGLWVRSVIGSHPDTWITI